MLCIHKALKISIYFSNYSINLSVCLFPAISFYIHSSITTPSFHIHVVSHLVSCLQHSLRHLLSQHAPSVTNCVHLLLFTALITFVIFIFSLQTSSRSFSPRPLPIVNFRSSNSHSSCVTSNVQVLPFTVLLTFIFIVF